MLDRADFEAGKLVEHAGEQHRAERVADPVIGRRAAGSGQLGDVHGEFVGRNAVTRRADMEQQRVLQFLCRRPETVVNRAAVRLVRLWRDRDKGADKAEFGDPLQLLGGRIRIIDIEHRDALQPIGVRLAEIGDPIVVAAADFREQLAVRHAVPEESLARLQHRTPDAVLFVLDQHRVGLICAPANIFPDPEKIDL